MSSSSMSSVQFRPSSAFAAPSLLAAILALGMSAAHAQYGFEEEFDDKDKPWQEIAIQLPAAPAAGDLLPFYVSPTATQSFAIDPKSLTIGADGVIRYTLVSQSQGGASNVSYEGIRCNSFEKKLYAFGRADGTWARSRRDQWEPITDNQANRQHAALAKDYFCNGNAIAGKADDIVKRIRNQERLMPHDGQ